MTHGNDLFLMIALIISIFFSTFRHPWANLCVAVFFLLSIIAAAYSVAISKMQFYVILVLCGSAIMPLWQGFVSNPVMKESLNDATWLALTFYAGLMIFRDVIRTRQITINEIYGRVSVYLLIGICFGMIYQLLIIFEPHALYFNPTNFKHPVPSDGEIFYYSFITLSTAGYGDVSPVAPLARFDYTLEAIIGVMYVATMIARPISIHTQHD